MIKSLTVTIENTEKLDHVSISGTRNEDAFEENIILRVGGSAMSVSSKELALALAAVVDFQTVVKVTESV